MYTTLFISLFGHIYYFKFGLKELPGLIFSHKQVTTCTLKISLSENIFVLLLLTCMF